MGVCIYQEKVGSQSRFISTVVGSRTSVIIRDVGEFYGYNSMGVSVFGQLTVVSFDS